jgi:hypothetical protein
MKGWGIVGLGMFVGCLNLAGFPLHRRLLPRT